VADGASRTAERDRQPPGRAARSVSVVIPAMNEARNIAWVVGRLPLSIDELILVDGRSTDRTVEVTRAIRPDVVVVDDGGQGKGAALRAGFEAATGDYVVMLDADGSMDPTEISAFIAALDDGADLVKGSRFLSGGGTADMTTFRYLGNRFLLLLANHLFRCAHTDLCYGYAAFRREVVRGLELSATGFEIETQLYMRSTRMGLRVAEVASFEAPRRSGTSNLHTVRDGWRVLRTLLRERRRGEQGPAPRAPEHRIATSLSTLAREVDESAVGALRGARGSTHIEIIGD
jgi:glycosyltransferase involved in cell wall biosynthesis